MNKRPTTTISLATAGAIVCLGVSIWLLVRRDSVEVPRFGSNTAADPETTENADADTAETSSQADDLRGLRRDVATTSEPVQQAAQWAKPTPSGLSVGPLPTPDFLRSEPRILARPEIRQGFEARTRRAATLNRRLEAHLADLRAKAEQADPSRRQAIEHDIAILESQLKARRAWESTTEAPSR